jgi:hypothetical protein
MPDTPLGGERLTRVDLDLGRHAGDGGVLVGRQVGEEGNRRNARAVPAILPPRPRER